MNRVVATATAALLIAAAWGGPAVARIDAEESTSFDPLEQVIGAVADGERLDGLTTEGTGAVVSHFQLLVNLASGPVFYEKDLDVTPVGIGADISGGLIDLSGELGANFAQTVQVPPLHPSAPTTTVGNSTLADLDTVFAGWEAFDDGGPRTDPVAAVEAPTVIWGIELAQPFDTSCATPSYVGRAWESRSATTANAPFTADAVDQVWPGTHGALADGTLGRLIQLSCQFGEPVVETVRMNPDLGRVRGFGPLDVIALVNGNHVVFITKARVIEDHALSPTFFASADVAGTVEIGGGAGLIPALVPNPYAAVPDRIVFEYDPDSIQLISLPPVTVPPNSGVQDLLYRPDEAPAVTRDLLQRTDGGASRIGVHCDVGVRILHARLAAEPTPVWGTQTSTWRVIERDGDRVTTSASYPDGSSDVVTFDLSTGEFTARVTQAPGSDQPDCTIDGTVTVNGAIADAGDAGTGGGDEDDSGDPSGAGDDDSAAEDSDGGGGLDLVVFGLVGLVVVGGVVTLTRIRTRQKPTDPNADGFLLEGLAGLGSEPDGDDPTDAGAGWTAAESREFAAQDDIKAIQEEAVREFSLWHGRYTRAMGRWAEPSARTWQSAEAALENQEDWKATQVAAKAVDLAWSLVQLARGLFAVGKGAVGFVRARQASVALSPGATARAAAEEAFAASPELTRFAEDLAGRGGGGLKTFRDELVEAVMWGQDAGVDAVGIMTTKLDDLTDMGMSGPGLVRPLVESVIRPVMAAKGLTFAPSHVADAVQGVSGALAKFGRGEWLNANSAEAVRTFVRMVDDTPGFWDDAGTMLIDYGKAAGPQWTGEMADLVTPDSLNTLRALYDAAKASGDDFTNLHILFMDRLGPAKATALTAGEGARAAMSEATADMILAAPKIRREGVELAADAAEAVMPDDPAARTGSLGNVDDHVGQYGITSDGFLGTVWDVLTAPVETGAGVYHSYQAQDHLVGLLEEHGDDLSEMAQGWSEMVNALDGLTSAIVDDDSARGTARVLGEALDRLESAQADLQRTFDNAPADWQAANRQRYLDKMAHIDKKKATIRRLVKAMEHLARRIERIRHEMREAMKSHDGDRRSALEWIDADMSAMVTAVSFELEAIASDVLATD